MLAGSCRSLQATLALQAMEAIDSGAAAWSPGQSTEILAPAIIAASARPRISIVLPQGLSEMRLR